MKIVKNIGDVNKVVYPLIEKAMILTRKQIFEIVWKHVNAYYHDPVFSPPEEMKPDEYERTGTLMESLTAGNIQKESDCMYFIVGFDGDYLRFNYPFSGKGTPATGYDVLNWNYEDCSHGGTVSGNVNIWQDSIDELNSVGGIENIFKNNCKKVGLNIIS